MNQKEEWTQKCAWRLVRSAEDRILESGRGKDRLLWALEQLRKEFPELQNHEDYIRAAFVNFKNETKALFA